LALSIFYVVARRVLSLVVVRFRPEGSKDLELVVLRHELSVLRRQVDRPKLDDADRVFLSAASRLLARKRWSVFVVTPETLLRWHRMLVAKRWTYLLFFIELDSRRVHLAGLTAKPTGPWVTQQARNLFLCAGDVLAGRKFLIRDRDTKFSGPFDEVFAIEGVRAMRTPGRSSRDSRMSAYLAVFEDRRWVKAWSPEQIANRLKVDFPDDGSMRISHEAIYQALYVQSRGALKRELVACLRTGGALRVPRARARREAWAHVTPEVMISERPAEAEDRALPGHWEGDLLIGLERSAIGTLVERTTRFTMLIHLPREEGYGVMPRTKNGPALADYGAVTMKNALAPTITTLPEQLCRSLTWDRGKEMSAHAQFKVETAVPVYFADPHSPWQRGTNENTNGLLRQYFPKGTDLSRWSADEIKAVAHSLNARPRKTLGWRTPAEALDEHLRSLQAAGVATTD
jgi:IS30 family transposase